MLSYDVIIAGGGTAGAVAGIASARAGARTLIIEQSGALGGVASTGMPWGGMFNSEHTQIIFGIPDALVERAVDMGAAGYVHYNTDDGRNWISALACIDSEIARLLLREELGAAGCDVYLYSSVSGAIAEGGRLAAVRVLTRGGDVDIAAKCFIDATGDASLAAMGGVNYERGSGDQRQCISSLIKISGVDLYKFQTFMNEHINTDNWYPWNYRDAPTRGGFSYWAPWKDYLDRFRYPPKQLGFVWSGFNGDVYLNCTNAAGDGLDALELSRADLIIRRQAREIQEFLRERPPGFENSCLSHIYDIGVRESRRIVGLTRVTLDDLLSGRKFADAVGLASYPPDHHTPPGDVKIVTHHDITRSNHAPAYEIPYSCMVNERVPNLITAGRCVSATFDAQTALRGIGPCMVEGEAAGEAAALAAAEGYVFPELPASKLQQRLIQNGVYIGEHI